MKKGYKRGHRIGFQLSLTKQNKKYNKTRQTAILLRSPTLSQADIISCLAKCDGLLTSFPAFPLAPLPPIFYTVATDF